MTDREIADRYRVMYETEVNHSRALIKRFAVTLDETTRRSKILMVVCSVSTLLWGVIIWGLR